MFLFIGITVNSEGKCHFLRFFFNGDGLKSDKFSPNFSNRGIWFVLWTGVYL